MLETPITTFSLPGYQGLAVIEDGIQYRLYRGIRACDQQAVVLKVFSSAQMDPNTLQSLRYEAEISQTLKLPGLPLVLGLEGGTLDPIEQDVVLVLEAFPGESLRHQMVRLRQGRSGIASGTLMSIDDILTIALKIIDLLGHLHEYGIVHRSLSASTLFWDPRDQHLSMINVGSFPVWELMPLNAGRSPLLQSVLPYLSPEQTERLNRPVDYRSDFYSLGVVLYELLTGEPPFRSSDPMELIHHHLARQPMPPHSLRSQIPVGLSLLVLKLLSKTPDDRYQSAYGLRQDLQYCQRTFQCTGDISAFSLGVQDRSSQLILAPTLYGREAALQQLWGQWQQVQQGRANLTLIAGEAGVGKSFLVQALQERVQQQAPSSADSRQSRIRDVKPIGYFVAGKCDELRQEIPYHGLLQALRHLLKQILTESDDRIAHWRHHIQQAIGNLGQILIEVLPEIELILGPQSPVPPLGVLESQNRFQLVLVEFIRVFAQPHQPLVLMLDDLQWADRAALKLLEHLLLTLGNQGLCIIGTYRPQEVGEAFRAFQGAIGDAALSITLNPLTEADLLQLTADALDLSPAVVSPLSQLLFQWTQGNPLFVHQLLTFLNSSDLLTFEFESGCWQWDLDRIAHQGVTEDVVALMVEKIRRLPIGTQSVLKIAACIGNEFEVAIVAQLSQQSLSWVHQQLSYAVRDGLLITTVTPDRHDLETLRFLHDRLQQAAYSLLSAAERQTLHWQVGQIGLRSMLESRQEDQLFNVVHQLNTGRERIQKESEKWQLTHLNLGAGKKAKSAAAYELALHYCETGWSLLGRDPWQHDYDLVFDLAKERAECQYCCGHLSDAQASFNDLLDRARTAPEKAEIHTIQMVLCITQSRQDEAIALGLKGLALLGIDLPTNPSPEAVHVTFEKLSDDLRQQGIESIESIDRLSQLPRTDSIQHRSALRLLQYLAAAAVTRQISLYQIAICQMVEISLAQGNSSYAAYAYVAYGSILSASQGDYRRGVAFGALALKVVDRLHALSGVTQFSFWGLLAHWDRPLAQCQDRLKIAFRACCETGEFLYALYVQVVMSDVALMSGLPLWEVDEQLQEFYTFAQHRQHQLLQQDALIKQQFVQALQNRRPPSDADRLTTADRPEWIDLDWLTTLPNVAASTTHSRYLIYQLQWLYLTGQYDLAYEIAQQSEALVQSHYGTAIAVEHYFYQALTIIAYQERRPSILSAEDAQYLTRNWHLLQNYAQHCPANFAPRFHLLTAELHRTGLVMGLLGIDQLDSADLTDLYDQAIVTAHRAQILQLEALASELAADYHDQHNRIRLSQHCLRDACHAYSQWGAIAKVIPLRQKLSQWKTREVVEVQRTLKLNLEELNSATTVSPPPPDLMPTIQPSLDWMTVLKASQALSSEIVFSSLMEKLMRILIENAGAQRGLLVTRRRGPVPQGTEQPWQVDAIGRVDRDRLEISVHVSQVLTEQQIPFSIIAYVERTHQTIVLDHALQDHQFGRDPYIEYYGTKSVLCFPILSQGKLSSILYLENNLAIAAFTNERLEVLKLLTAQVSISIENARLYGNLTQSLQEVEQKNQALKASQVQLQANTEELEQAFQRLQQTQAQLIQTEKMSSLGQLVAGVAHEIKNPLNFITGNLDYAKSYTQELIRLLNLYHQYYPDPAAEIATTIEQIDLPFILQDLNKLLQSMELGTDRIQNLVLALRNFSRSEESTMEIADLHDVLESTLLILQPHFRATPVRPAITIDKHYGDLPFIRCYPGLLSQACMNLVANAVDAIDEKATNYSFEENRSIPYRITLTTVVNDDFVSLRIQDTGTGMDEHTRNQLFNAFFTTKPVGKGTGLGLSISYQIVVERHQGNLSCETEIGAGTTFTLSLPVGCVPESEEAQFED